MALSAQLDGETFGRYRLVEPIGTGGMAVVYRAVAHTAEGPRTLVIKRILPELSRDPVFVKMLVGEARLSSRLNHPGIVQVFELGRVGNEYFLAMEHVDGIDLVRLLNRCIARKKPLPVGLVCHIVREVATALAYAHDLTDVEGRPLEIVHRDISPANIMVTVDGGVKLLDFGVAKAAEHIRDDRTRTGTLKGKVSYLSPEQAEGFTPDRRADVFALGIVLYEILTLKRLFRADTDLATLRLVRECNVTPPSQLRADVPPELDAIVMQMMARDPGQRFARCEAIAQALAPLAKGQEALREFLVGLGPVAAEDRAPEICLEMESGPTRSGLEPELLVEAGLRRRASRLALFGGTALLVAGVMALGAVALYTAHVRPAGATTTPATATAPSATTTAAPATASAPAATATPATTTAPSATTPATATTPSAPTPAPSATATSATTARTATRAPSHLVISVDVAAARLVLDGKVLADSAHRLRVPVERPGPHLLEVTAPRRKPYARTIVIPVGGELEVAVKLEHAAVATRPAARPHGDYLVDPFGRK
jgi:tRNA A-37 threonylcarbamoyl transferase component Bud32